MQRTSSPLDKEGLELQSGLNCPGDLRNQNYSHMKTKIRYWIILLGMPLFFLSGRMAFAGPEDYQLAIRNIVQTAPNRIEFDLLLLDTDPLNDFWLSTEQFGILFNSSIYSGGTISASIVNTSSGLGPFQVIYQAPEIETNAAYSGQTLLKLVGNVAYIPLGQCTLISKTSPGTLITHFVLTSTVNFVSGTVPDFVFTSSAAVNPLYATRVSVSDGTQVSDMTVTPGTNAIVVGNPVLNAAPAAFNVTGGGTYCEGAGGLPVGLTGSELGVTYTLYRGGAEVAPTVEGTGSTISFGNQTAGIYTVSGTNTGGTTAMTGSAEIIMTPLPATPGTITGSAVQCSGVTGQTYSVAEVTGATSYNWSFPAGWAITGGSGTRTVIVTVGTTGGTISVTASNVCGTGPARTLDVTVNQTPAISNKTETISSGSTFNVTPAEAPVGTTYTWPAPVYTGGVTGGVAQSTGVSSISGTLTIPSGSGTAVYTVTPMNGTCAGSTFTVTVTVTSACVPVVISADPVSASFCAGGSTTFNITATGTTPAYQWQYYNGATWVSVANGTPLGAVYNNATTTTLGVSGVTEAGIYQYRCSATNCSGSTDISEPATLTVSAIPATPTVNVTQPNCATPTGTITITNPTGAGMTYSIDGSTYTNTTGIFSGVVPGIYSVTARSSAGCTSPAASATVNPQPPTPVVGNQTATISSGGTFNVIPAGVPVGTTYTWPAPTYTNGVTGGVAQPTGVTSISGTLTIPSGSGTAVYTVTPTTGTCVGNTFTVTVTVNSTCTPVSVTTHPAPAAMCAGANAAFTVVAGGTSPFVYQWEYYNGTSWVNVAAGTPAGASYTGAAIASLTVSGITPAGNYQYRCHITNCSGGNVVNSDPATLTVNANPPQPVITADGPTTFCTGEDVVLTATESAGYLWSTGATTRSITVTTAGNYTVQVTNAAGCQSVLSATTVVTVNPLPSRPTITPAGSVTICAGSSQTLTSSAGVTYLWSNGETTQSISVNTTGTYTVQVTNSFGCLSTASLPTTVTVNPVPATPTITASGATTFCAGGSVTLTSSLATTYLWSTGATTRSITVNSTGNYWVRVADAAGCQSAQSSTTVVTVNPLPSAPTIGTITQPTCTVSTGSVVLGGLPAGSWTVNPGNITGSTSTVIVTGLVAGSYTFTVTNSNGCTSSASASVVINTQPAVPTVPIVSAVTQPTCAVTTGSVGFSGLPSTGSWTLTRLPGGEETGGSGITVTLSGIPSGSYTFTVTNSVGCTSAATGTVTINAPLPVPTAPVQTVDCTLGFNQAVVTVTSPVGAGYEYRLDAGAFQTGTSFSNVANGNHTITVRNASLCTTTGPTFSVNCGCVNPPLVTLSATTGSTCGTTAVTVSGNTFGGSATSVTITENGGGTVTPASSSTSPFSFTYTPTAADAGRTVVITVTTNNPLGSPCAAASATYTLTVNANPAAPVPGTVTQPTCALPTGSVVLGNLPASGDWTVTRTPGGNTYTGSGTSTTVTGLSPGTYSFAVTNALGCTSAASANVVINAQPETPSAPVVGVITQPTCALSTGSVAFSGLPATGTWTLTRTPGNVSVTGTGTTRTVSGIIPGTYTFTVANAAGCISTNSAEVVINLQPVTPSAPVIGTITHPTCDLSTGSILLENMPANGEWTLIRYPGGISSTGTGSSTTISSLTSGTYNFAVTNADGCTSLVSGNATINPQPPTPTAPVVGTITHPTLTVPTGSVVLSGLPSSGTWTLTRYPDGFTSQGTGTTRTVSGLEPGTYTFTVTNSLGCTSAATGNVVINARPGAPVVVINNPPNICSDQTADLTQPAITAGSDPNLTFTYWTDAGATIALASPASVPAGTYYIRGTSTAGYSTIRPVVVTADELPVANAGFDQVLEYLFGTVLNAETPAVGVGIWALVSGTGEIFNSAAPSTQVNGLSVGDNVFSWTVTNGACYPVTDFVTVKVNNLAIPTLITPNQDGANDYFILRGLQTLGRTELIVFDRRGMKVYENRDYDNLWDGVDYNSNPLPDDTYFYVVRAQNGVSLSGYIVIRR